MSGGAPLAPPGPGWYPDPEMVGTLRYWDGELWTEHRAPMAPTQGPQRPPVGTESIVIGILLAALVIAALVFIGWAIIDTVNDEAAERGLTIWPWVTTS